MLQCYSEIMKTDQIRDKYLKAASAFRGLEAKEERILLYLSALRFISFTGGLILIWIGFTISLIAGIILIPVVVIIFLSLL